MGYTHYFKLTKPINRDHQDLAVRLCKSVMRAIIVTYQNEASDNGVMNEQLVNRYRDNKQPEIINDLKKPVIFNGKGEDLSHEDFWFDQFDDESTLNGFAFCKTARKPYDRAVGACLLAVATYFPSHFEISSDGDINDEEEWGPAKELFVKALRVMYGDDKVKMEGFTFVQDHAGNISVTVDMDLRTVLMEDSFVVVQLYGEQKINSASDYGEDYGQFA